MGFIMDVLIVSALLSIIFGKRIGALFATGVLGVAALVVTLCLLAVVVYVFGGDTTSHPASTSSSYSSYGNSSGATPAYGSSQTYTPVAQTPAPSQTYTPPPAPTYQTPSLPTGPRIGVVLAAVPANMVQYLNVDVTGADAVPAGGGCLIIAMQTNGPAERAGLRPYDVILSGGLPGQTVENLSLDNYTALMNRSVDGRPVWVNIYRQSERRKFGYFVYPR